MQNVKIGISLLLLICSPLLAAPPEQEPAGEERLDLDWQAGPAQAALGDSAELKIPSGWRFLDGDNARKLLEAMGNPPTDRELGLAMRTDADWFIVFEFDEVGYVRDDERDTLDANALLKQIREGTAAGNKWRQEHGQPALNLVGWHSPPAYNARTQNLEWATLLESQGHKVVNHNVRLLGRRGVMEVTLVLAPEEARMAMPQLEKLLQDYHFKSGERYAEFREGDKVAAYGLAALVAGGAAAVGAKSGLFGKLIKFIVVGVAALGAALKRFWSRIFPSKDRHDGALPPPPGQE
ncbi:MAG: DUF2167 domain-containing protein [Leptospirales bacterium]|nr:DUF2167 domain-containing protein [Leptospirales bacterium]